MYFLKQYNSIKKFLLTLLHSSSNIDANSTRKYLKKKSTFWSNWHGKFCFQAPEDLNFMALGFFEQKN
jgi:hypothetical protein